MSLHSPLGPQLDQLLGLSRLNPIFTNCALSRVFLHSFHTDTPVIFPPLLPTITLDFPTFTFSPLSRRLALHSTTLLPSCSNYQCHMNYGLLAESVSFHCIQRFLILHDVFYCYSPFNEISDWMQALACTF